MRVAFVLVDGLGDNNLPQLGGRTTLQAAETPVMDAMAAAGVTGLMDPVEPGLACGSDTAHLSIFGYPPRTHYRGRGAFETMGTGLEMTKGDVAFKCNFATLDVASGTVTSRRADRHFEAEGPVLSEALNGLPIPGFPEHTVAVKYATEHRCAVRLRGPGLSDRISGTDPLKDGRPLVLCKPLDETREADFSARLTMAVSNLFHETLRAHPINAERQREGKDLANVVLLRGAGIRIDVPPFEDVHGLKPFMIAPTAIIAGLGRSLEMDVVTAPGATGDYRTNLLAKSETLADTFAHRPDYGFGFLHIKAVDDTGHDKNVDLKVHFIEKTDRMLADLVSRLAALRTGDGAEDDFLLCLTGDHSTPVVSGDHSVEPVPFVLCRVSQLRVAADGASVAAAPAQPDAADVLAAFRDGVQTFDEIACAAGCLGRFPGTQAMATVRRFAQLA